MRTLKSSRIIKFLLHSLMFVSGALILLGSYYLTHYVSNYPSSTESFLETSEFQSKFLKYVERTAVYCRYREIGYTPADTSIYTAADPSQILTPSPYVTTLPSDNVHVASQESFDYYNYLLNQCETNFIYYVKNLNTGKVYCSPQLITLAGGIEHTEAYLNELKASDAYLKLNTQSKRYVTNVNRGYQYLNEPNINWVIDYLEKGLTESDTTGTDSYVLYAYVLDDFPYSEDEFFPRYQRFSEMRYHFNQWIELAPAVLLCFLLCFIGAAVCAGHKRKVSGIFLSRFDRLYTELAAGIILILTFLILNLFGYTDGFYLQLLHYEPEVQFMALYVLLYPVLATGLFSLIRRLKAHSLLRDSLIYRILAWIAKAVYRFVINRHLTFRAALIVLVFCLIQAVAVYGLIFIQSWVFLLLLIADYLLLTSVLVRIAMDLNIVMSETRKIADGDINHKVPTEHLLSPARELSGYINNIQSGFSTAVEDRIKSERLKTELITNVSHDIKTPLTSIINYVDLLNKLPLDNETAVGYLNILTEKSWRLKNLIDDLVEASKASSGTLTLHFERLNVGELLKQAIGEFKDRFSEHNLEIVATLSDTPLYVMADGRSTYRIIENLFSNVTKYALPGTRVYIEMLKTDGNALLSVKNISAARLSTSGKELMERFVRGDIARNTEGSGLGLSIAQSLALLQHGTFDLVLDGDLFKVLFSLPLCDSPAVADAPASQEASPLLWDEADFIISDPILSESAAPEVIAQDTETPEVTEQDPIVPEPTYTESESQSPDTASTNM